MSNPHCRLLASFAAVLIIGAGLPQSVTPAAAQSAPSGFANKGLVGIGRLLADMKDKFGETLGSGSGLAADQKSWTKTADGYSGTFYILPTAAIMLKAPPITVRGSTRYPSRSSRSKAPPSAAPPPKAMPSR